jgi:hypothetical protein
MIDRSIIFTSAVAVGRCLIVKRVLVPSCLQVPMSAPLSKLRAEGTEGSCRQIKSYMFVCLHVSITTPKMTTQEKGSPPFYHIVTTNQ